MNWRPRCNSRTALGLPITCASVSKRCENKPLQTFRPL